MSCRSEVKAAIRRSVSSASALLLVVAVVVTLVFAAGAVSLKFAGKASAVPGETQGKTVTNESAGGESTASVVADPQGSAVSSTDGRTRSLSEGNSVSGPVWGASNGSLPEFRQPSESSHNTELFRSASRGVEVADRGEYPSRVARDVRVESTVAIDGPGTIERIINKDGIPAWGKDRDKYVSTFKVGDAGVFRLKKLNFRVVKAKGYAIQHFEEQAHCGTKGKGPCIGVLIQTPDNSFSLNSFDLSPTGGGNWGDNWKFKLKNPNNNKTNDVVLNADGLNLDIDFVDLERNGVDNAYPQGIELPAGTEIKIVYAFDYNKVLDDDQIEAPQDNHFLTVTGPTYLKTPGTLDVCTVSTIYNGSGGNSQPTTLHKQELGEENFTNIGADGWKYNAMVYKQPPLDNETKKQPGDGYIYAISQELPGEVNNKPGGHLLVIDPKTGEVTDLGKLRGFPEGDAGRNDKNLISSGFFTPEGKYWITNAATSGTGNFYEVDMQTGQVQRQYLQWDTNGEVNGVSVPAAMANDYAVIPGHEEYAFGLVSQIKIRRGDKELDIVRPTLERITLSGENKGRIDRFDLTALEDPAGQVIPQREDGKPLPIYGAAWSYQNGVLGFDRNDGKLFQLRITNPGADHPTIDLLGVGQAPRNSNNDGASCIAPAKPDVSVQKLPINAQSLPEANESAKKKFDLSWEVTVTNESATDASGGYRLVDNFDKDLHDIYVDHPKDEDGHPLAKCTVTKGYEYGAQAAENGSSHNETGAAMVCFGGELSPGEKHTFTISANLKPASVPNNAEEGTEGTTSGGDTQLKCRPNLAKVEGVDLEPTGEEAENNNKSKAGCFSVKKTSLADQDLSQDEKQDKAPILTPAADEPEGKYTVTARYGLQVLNQTPPESATGEDGGATEDSGMMPHHPVIDEPKAPAGMRFKGVKIYGPYDSLESAGASDNKSEKLLQSRDYTVESEPLKITVAPETIGKIKPNQSKNYVVEITWRFDDYDSFTGGNDAQEKLECGSGGSEQTTTTGLFNTVSMTGEALTPGTIGDADEDNDACVSAELLGKAKVKKGAEGQQVSVQPNRTATLKYRITVFNESAFGTANTGEVTDVVQLPDKVHVNGQVEIIPDPNISDEPQKPRVTGLQRTIPQHQFVDEVVIAENVELPAKSSQAFVVAIPVKVQATSTDDWEQLGECSDGADTVPRRGVYNGSKIAQATFDDNVEDNTACISLIPPKASITVAKIDPGRAPLAGAAFGLYGDNSGQTGDKISGPTSTTGADGAAQAVTFSDVSAGKYHIVETKAPGGYNLRPASIPVTIAYNTAIDGPVYSYTVEEKQLYSGLVSAEAQENGTLYLTVADVMKGDLPKTGSSQLLLLTLLGGGLFAAAALISRLNRRHNRKS